MALSICKLPDARVAEAFQLISKVTNWLNQKGHRQRISLTTLETYQDWQADGCNYLVMNREGNHVENHEGNRDRIAGIFSIINAPMLEWPDLDQQKPVFWLRALVTHPEFQGQGVGPFAISQSLEIAGHGNPLYLDCVSGFLPEYYTRHGFEWLASRSIVESNGTVFEVNLLRHTNRATD